MDLVPEAIEQAVEQAQGRGQRFEPLDVERGTSPQENDAKVASTAQQSFSEFADLRPLRRFGRCELGLGFSGSSLVEFEEGRVVFEVVAARVTFEGCSQLSTISNDM
jgi:hypothetical protein